MTLTRPSVISSKFSKNVSVCVNSNSDLQGYRPDIDGLRAIAVLSVIAFHMGFLPNGYLGVDVLMPTEN